MSRRLRRCSAALALALALPAAQGREHRLLFTGDILLGREVAHEVDARHGASPWIGLDGELSRADVAMGNLEGSVGDPAACAAPAELCFATPPRLLPLLKQAGFTAIGVANNHSGDLGPEGRERTRRALADAGLPAIGTAESPAFVRLGDRTVAIVALDLVPARDGVVDAIPSWQAGQKLRLAHALADWTIAYVHWGKELTDWVVPEQRAQAQWLIAHGADVVIGMHPHVVQPPECIGGKPVFFSLGNHVFDQKYLQTKRGLIADCRISGATLACGSLWTDTPRGSSYPRLERDRAGPALCPVPAAPVLAADGWTLRAWTPEALVSTGRTMLEAVSARASWRTRAQDLLAADFGTLEPGKPPLLFTLERHRSSMDAEDGPRPYVYEVSAHGLVPRWRGSALAWPLLDARLLADADGKAWLCALHRGDSFLAPASRPAPPHVLVYAWNGFGFSGHDEPGLMDRCRKLFDDGLESRTPSESAQANAG